MCAADSRPVPTSLLDPTRPYCIRYSTDTVPTCVIPTSYSSPRRSCMAVEVRYGSRLAATSTATARLSPPLPSGLSCCLLFVLPEFLRA